MLRMVDKVTQKGFEKILREGVQKPHNLGDKLYLVINGKSRDFSFRYTKNKITRKYSLKPYHAKTNTLADARKRALELNAMLAQGLDPHEEKQFKIDLKFEAKQQKLAAEQVKANTFVVVAENYMASKRAKWADKTTQSWENTLKTYAYPVIGDMAVVDISKFDIERIVRPIWISKPDLSTKLLQRIRRVFSRAIYLGLITSNPAMHRDNLEDALDYRDKPKAKHWNALDYKLLPDFMSELLRKDEMAAKALQFCVLNATRTSETLGARWEEFDMDQAIWTIPCDRLGIKNDDDHEIPLTDQALKFLSEMKDIQSGKYVFGNLNTGKPLSNGAMLMLIRRMGYSGKITVHGFRSSFRDFIAEETDFANIVAEMALAHSIKSASERAYRRGKLLKRRAKMMQFYADYVMGVDSQVGKILEFKKK